MDSNKRRSQLARKGYTVDAITRPATPTSRTLYRGRYKGASVLHCVFAERQCAWAFLDTFDATIEARRPWAASLAGLAAGTAGPAGQEMF